jgi:hypothetical protein
LAEDFLSRTDAFNRLKDNIDGGGAMSTIALNCFQFQSKDINKSIQISTTNSPSAYEKCFLADITSAYYGVNHIAVFLTAVMSLFQSFHIDLVPPLVHPSRKNPSSVKHLYDDLHSLHLSYDYRKAAEAFMDYSYREK